MNAPLLPQRPADSADRTATWARLHLVDIVTLLLGTGLTVRFWYLFFGVGDRRLITILAVIAACEVAKRFVVSRRRWQRPYLFCAERRGDLMAAIALGSAPWPITMPVNAASPLWTIGQPLAQSGWIAPLAAVFVVAVAIRRLLPPEKKLSKERKGRKVR